MVKIREENQVKYPYLEEPVKVYTLENGHTVILAKKESGMVNISSWVKTGSINENSCNNGVSHFLEHLMFKGTTKYKAGEFDKILESKGGIINAATWKDYTFYYVTITKEHLNLAIKMHADMMTDPTIPDDEIGPAFDINGEPPEDKRERYVVIEEIKMRQDQNWSKVYNKLNSAMYKEHPYKRDVIGTAEIISTIPRDSIMEYYETHYTPENISTIVVGDFNEKDVLEKVSKEFTFKRAKKTENEIHKKEIRIEEPTYIEQASEVNTAYAMFGFLADSAKNLKESIALDLLSIILGDGKSSRLNIRFIEEAEKPHYYALDTAHYQFKDGENFFVNANFEPSKKDDVLREIKEELSRLNEISEEELKKAKKRTKAQFAQDAETVSDIADSIGFYMTVCEDLNMINDYQRLLEEIDTRYLEEIAVKYLSPDLCSVSVLIPKTAHLEVN